MTTQYKDGDRYLLTMTGKEWADYQGKMPQDVEIVVKENGTRLESIGTPRDWWEASEGDRPGYEIELTPLSGDPVNSPSHYVFPSGVETIQISEWLSANGAQAMQYIVKATRVDGKTKGNVIEDLRKAIWFAEREIQRIEGLNK